MNDVTKNSFGGGDQDSGDADGSLLFLMLATALFADNWTYECQVAVGRAIDEATGGRIGPDSYESKVREVGDRLNAANREGRWTEQVKQEVEAAVRGHDPATIIVHLEGVAAVAGGKQGDSRSFIETVRRAAAKPAERTAKKAVKKIARKAAGKPEGGDDGRARPEIVGVGKEHAAYIENWTAPTQAYAGKTLAPLIPPFIDGIIDAAPPRNADDLDTIIGRIREHKVIPILHNAPFDRDLQSNVWWFIPGVVLAERLFSWVAVTENGIYTSNPDDPTTRVGVCSWDSAGEVIFERLEDGCAQLHFVSDEGTLTLAEFMNDGDGSMLEVIKAIHEVYLPVIEASRGSGVWFRGSGGERYVRFDDGADLLVEDRWLPAEADDGGAAAADGEDDGGAAAADGEDAGDAGDPPGDLTSRMQAICYLFLIVGLADGEFSEEEIEDVLMTLKLWAGDNGVEEYKADFTAAVAVFNNLDTADERLALRDEVVRWLGESESPKWRWEIVNRLDDLIRADGSIHENELSQVKRIAAAWDVEFTFSEVGAVASGAGGEDAEESPLPALNWEPTYLSRASDPPYPGRYFFVTPPLETKILRVKMLPAVENARELFPSFSRAETDAIATAIDRSGCLPRLDFVKDAMQGVFAVRDIGATIEDNGTWTDISQEPAPFWFLPFVVFEDWSGMVIQRYGGVLWMNENGLFVNYEAPNVLSLTCSSNDIDGLATYEGIVDDEAADGCTTLAVETDSDKMNFYEFHGDEWGSLFAIVKACWGVAERTLIEPSRNLDHWSYDGVNFENFSSWQEVLEWAQKYNGAGDSAPPAADGDESGGADITQGASPDPAPLTVEADTPQTFIDRANAIHRTGEAWTVTARELFGEFGFQRRGIRTVAVVETAIADAGLEAFPSVVDGSFDGQTEIRLGSGVAPGAHRVARGAGGRSRKPAEAAEVVVDDSGLIVVPATIAADFVTAASAAHAGDPPVTATVREILGWFGARKRGAKVQAEILAAFEGARLTTFPDFASADIDSVVEIRLAEGVQAGVHRVEHR